MGVINEIKKDAIGNRIKIQSSDALRLEKIFNRMFFLEKDVEKESQFVHQVMTRGAETQERIGLHASSFIKGDKEWCLRQQVLSLVYRQLQGEQLSVGLKRIFEEGNAVHEKWQRLFLRAGYCEVNDLDVTQFDTRFRISFTPDIICEISEFYDGKMVGELKSVNTYSFQKMTRHPSAWKQLQWYMYLCIKKAQKEGIWNERDYVKGFVLSEDKNTQDFKIEVYDFDENIVKPFIDKARDVKNRYKILMSEHKLVGRPEDAKSPECKRCEDCALRNACWKINGGGEKIIKIIKE